MSKKTTILSVALFVSLLGNFFLGGHMVGRFHGFHDMMPRDAMFHEKLSAADKKVLRESMDMSRDKMESLRDKLDNARKTVGQSLRAEPFDAKALQAALTAERDVKMEFLVTMHDARAGAAKKLSPQGRAALSKMDRMGDRKPPKNCPPPPVE